MEDEVNDLLIKYDAMGWVGEAVSAFALAAFFADW
jgi:hypothetical protein